MSILEVKNLSKRYKTRGKGGNGSTYALKNVSFSLHPGERLGIIGPSGCGKTTLLKLVLGLSKPTSGSVIKTAAAGFVAQDPYSSLCHAMTVRSIIAEPLIYGGVFRFPAQCESDVRRVMNLVSLDFGTFAGRYPHELSGGERQRVSIARALIARPGFLALDEPTSMVDYEVKSGIADVLRLASNAESCALLLVTHDISLAAGLCENLLVMRDGEFVERAAARDIIENPRQEHTRRLVVAATDLAGYWAGKECGVNAS